jgi:hypothetical protein
MHNLTIIQLSVRLGGATSLDSTKRGYIISHSHWSKFAPSEPCASAGIAELAPTSWFSASWTTGVALHPPWFSGDMGSPTVSLDREVSNLWSSWRNAFTH